MEVLIAQLYAVVGIISLIGYLPQIKLLIISKRAPTEISIKTWTLWTLENVVALAYGIFCLKDFLFCALTALDLICTSTIIILVMHNRYVKYGSQKNLLIAFVKYYFRKPFFAIADECSSAVSTTCHLLVPGHLKRQWRV
jgi:uncharacterized protein with PQ loop repeat